MYDLPYHKEKDEQIIKKFVDQHLLLAFGSVN